MSRPLIPGRIGRLLPLLGSDNPGEVFNTNRAILSDLRSIGLDWRDVAIVRKASDKSSRSSQPAAHPAFFDLARACRDLEKGILTPRERAFVGEMVRRGRLSPSPKQARWLSDIYGKIQDELAA